MSKSDIVSVVTPFYNTAKYLRECIESVLRQTYSNIEYILHDNASDDGSSEIAQEYAARDKRIRLIRNDVLLPQVPNYNRALTFISPGSRYCKMVQADDWIFPECLDRMIAIAATKPRVGLVSSFRLDGDTVNGDGLPYRQETMSGRDVCRLHLLGRVFPFGSPTTVLFRSEIIRNRHPFFEEDRFQEDTEICFEVLKEWDFGYVPQVLSYSRVEPDSLFSKISRYGNAALGRLVLIHRYGRHFLEPSEYDERWRLAQKTYYRQLGRALLQLRERGYWHFHLRELNREGLVLEHKRLTWGVISEIGDILGNPKMSLGRLIVAIRGK